MTSEMYIKLRIRKAKKILKTCIVVNAKVMAPIPEIIPDTTKIQKKKIKLKKKKG